VLEPVAGPTSPVFPSPPLKGTALPPLARVEELHGDFRRARHPHDPMEYYPRPSGFPSPFDPLQQPNNPQFQHYQQQYQLQRLQRLQHLQGQHHPRYQHAHAQQADGSGNGGNGNGKNNSEAAGSSPSRGNVAGANEHMVDSMADLLASELASMGGLGMSDIPFALRAMLPPNWRTKTCSFWQEGRCTKGDTCTYAHSNRVMQGALGRLKSGLTGANSPNYRTKLCTYYAQGQGFCKFGANCSFVHDTPPRGGSGGSGNEKAIDGKSEAEDQEHSFAHTSQQQQQDAETGSVLLVCGEYKALAGLVRHLTEGLRRASVRVSLDDGQTDVEQALSRSAVVVPILTHQAESSPRFRQVLQSACANHLPIAPIKAEQGSWCPLNSNGASTWLSELLTRQGLVWVEFLAPATYGHAESEEQLDSKPTAPHASFVASMRQLLSVLEHVWPRNSSDSVSGDEESVQRSRRDKLREGSKTSNPESS
jgi:hypothetical protein